MIWLPRKGVIRNPPACFSNLLNPSGLKTLRVFTFESAAVTPKGVNTQGGNGKLHGDLGVFGFIKQRRFSKKVVVNEVDQRILKSS